MKDEKVPQGRRGYHDIGGVSGGEIPQTEVPWMHWEKQTEAVRNLLGDGTRRIISLDELRRGFESFGEYKYRSLSFYRRRLEAMIDILIEKEIISKSDLDLAVSEKRKIWQNSTSS